MESPDAIKREQGLWMLHKMRVIRQVSERIVELYPTDVMETPVHLCIGQEAVSVGLCAHLNDADKIFLGHRTHGPALAKGLPLEKLMAELYGRTAGCSRGVGGSMHLLDLERGIPGSSAIVGGSIALGVGAALSAKLQSSRMPGYRFISVSYFGDAATNTGVFYESLNYAALQKLPVLFLCENNGLSNVMPVDQHSFTDIVSVARQFMPVFRADGTDVLSVYAEAGKAVQRVREKNHGPIFVECKTKRWMKHQGHEVDDLDCNPIDRTKDCPIRKLQSFLLGASMVTASEIREMTARVEREIDSAIEFAEASPYPTADVLRVMEV